MDEAQCRALVPPDSTTKPTTQQIAAADDGVPSWASRADAVFRLVYLALAAWLASPPNNAEAKDTVMTTNAGKVTLLSAGPGDLDLLTLKAAKALAAAAGAGSIAQRLPK